MLALFPLSELPLFPPELLPEVKPVGELFLVEVALAGVDEEWCEVEVEVEAS